MLPYGSCVNKHSAARPVAIVIFLPFLPLKISRSPSHTSTSLHEWRPSTAIQNFKPQCLVFLPQFCRCNSWWKMFNRTRKKLHFFFSQQCWIIFHFIFTRGKKADHVESQPPKCSQSIIPNSFSKYIFSLLLAVSSLCGLTLFWQCDHLYVVQ